jgi:hypothetical protein
MTTVSIRAAVSSAMAFLNRMPRLAPSPVPTMTAVGVARPSASGQVITTTVMANRIASLNGRPASSHATRVAPPPTSATSTSQNAPASPPPGFPQKRPADPELHQRGHHQHRQPPAPVLHERRPGQDGRHREHRGGRDQDHPPEPGSASMLLRVVAGLGRVRERGEAVPDLLDPGLQVDRWHRTVHGHLGAAGGQVHLGIGHAVGLGQHPLDPGRAGATGHPLDREVDPGGVLGARGQGSAPCLLLVLSGRLRRARRSPAPRWRQPAGRDR